MLTFFMSAIEKKKKIETIEAVGKKSMLKVECSNPNQLSLNAWELSSLSHSHTHIHTLSLSLSLSSSNLCMHFTKDIKKLFYSYRSI